MSVTLLAFNFVLNLLQRYFFAKLACDSIEGS